MKKLQILWMFLIIAFLVGCGATTTTPSGNNGSTTNERITTSTESTNVFIDPFIDLSFIKHLTLDNAVIDLINDSSGRIAYIDNDIYVYYDETLSPSSFYVYRNGKTTKFDTHAPMSYSDNFIINYDTTNQVIYYYDSNSVETIPNDIDDSMNLYGSSVGDLNYYNSQYSLIANTFITFRGETLFTGEGTTVFPRENIDDDLVFYVYQSNHTQTDSCSIQTYHDFDDTPETTLVHDEFTCSPDYVIKNGNVVIKLLSGSRLAGYVTITKDEAIHVMDFSRDIDLFSSYDFDTFRVVNEWLIYFRYEDTLGETHHVVTNYDLSYIAIDEMDADGASENSYIDDQYRFRKYNALEYRLYKNEERFYTYVPGSAYFTYVNFFRSGDFGVITELNITDGSGKITRINLTDGTETVDEKTDFSVTLKQGKYLMISIDNSCYLYDIVNDEYISIGVSGSYRAVNETYFLIYSDDYVYLYNIENHEKKEMNLVGELRRTKKPYAFLVEYNGAYFLIG